MDQGAESFELRVKRLFGSKLFETVPKSSFPSASWSVADGEVERREWNRDRGAEDEREDNPCSSAFYDKDGCLLKNRKSRRDKQREFEGDLDDVDDDNEDEEDEMAKRGEEENDEGREEREIRSSVGLDPTLDNEDEEDEYDKRALGNENSGERVYMRDVKNHSPYLNYNAIIPEFLDEPSDEPNHFLRDPRADHFGASVRLKEDTTSAEGDSVHNESESSRKSPVEISQNNVSVKPILKRKEDQIDTKPKKRVRFDPELKDEDKVIKEVQAFPTVPQSMETSEASEVFEGQASSLEESLGVPDYLRNPSKYTHYTFDSSVGIDEATNRRAFDDFHKLLNKLKSDVLEPEFSLELPKSVAFTPRKKAVVAVPMDESPSADKQNGQVLGSSMGVAASEDDGDDSCEMDEDDSEAAAPQMNTSSRRGRQYRSKSMSDDSG